MKKFITKSIVAIVFTLICSTPIYARENKEPIDTTNAIDVTGSDTKEAGEKKAGINGTARGDWLAEVFLEISNPQNGNIGVEMITSCYAPVDRVLMGLYVDKVNENNAWTQVDYKVFEFLPEDFSDGKLVEAIISIQLTGHEPGWYRLRGLHLVTKGDDDEFYSTETGGIEITDRSIFGLEETASEEACEEATEEISSEEATPSETE